MPVAIAENDGSSYFFFTAVTAATAALSILLDQQIANEGTRVWFAIQATLLYALNIAGVFSLFWREWIGQAAEISPPMRSRLRLAGYRIPWRLVRIVDHYVGINLAFSQIFMVFWVWDSSPLKDTYFSFPAGLAATNHWAAWLSFIGTSFAIYNGVGFAEFSLNSSAVVAVATWHIALAKPIDLIVAAIVVAEGYEIVSERRRGERNSAEKAMAERELPGDDDNDAQRLRVVAGSSTVL